MPLDTLADPLVVDNAIPTCVEVHGSLEAKRLKLRFTVLRPIYKCGCPSAAVGYSISTGSKLLASDHFASMKYTDRLFEADRPLGLQDAAPYIVTVGCKVD